MRDSTKAWIASGICVAVAVFTIAVVDRHGEFGALFLAFLGGSFCDHAYNLRRTEAEAMRRTWSP